MANEVPKNSPGEAIIAEEERLFGQVEARIAMGEEEEPGRVSVGTDDIDRDLLSLRDQIAEAKPEDLAPLVEQMTRLAALRGRLGEAGVERRPAVGEVRVVFSRSQREKRQTDHPKHHAAS